METLKDAVLVIDTWKAEALKVFHVTDPTVTIKWNVGEYSGVNGHLPADIQYELLTGKTIMVATVSVNDQYVFWDWIWFDRPYTDTDKFLLLKRMIFTMMTSGLIHTRAYINFNNRND